MLVITDSRVCPIDGVCGPAVFISGGFLEPSGERDRERVQRGLLPPHPACSTPAGGVKRSRHQVEAFERRLLVGEAPTRPDASVVSVVDRLDRVRGSDHPAGLDVVLKERHELRPGNVSELDDYRIPLAPLGRELLEQVLHGKLARGRIDGFEGLHDRITSKCAAISVAEVLGQLRFQHGLEDSLRELVEQAARPSQTHALFPGLQPTERVIKPRIGNLSTVEATAERLQRFLDTVRVENGPSTVKTARAVLSGMLGLATWSDAIRQSPVRELQRIASRAKAKAKGAVAVPLDELAALLEGVRRDSRMRDLDLVDAVEFVAGTGVRISEALAIRWDGVDPAADTVTICANVVRATGARRAPPEPHQDGCPFASDHVAWCARRYPR